MKWRYRGKEQKDLKMIQKKPSDDRIPMRTFIITFHLWRLSVSELQDRKLYNKRTLFRRFKFKEMGITTGIL